MMSAHELIPRKPTNHSGYSDRGNKSSTRLCRSNASKYHNSSQMCINPGFYSTLVTSDSFKCIISRSQLSTGNGKGNQNSICKGTRSHFITNRRVLSHPQTQINIIKRP